MLSPFPEILRGPAPGPVDHPRRRRGPRERGRSRVRRREDHPRDRQFHDPPHSGLSLRDADRRSTATAWSYTRRRQPTRRCGERPWPSSVDGHPRHGVGTGISASDRARTARLLADPAALDLTTWSGRATSFPSGPATAASLVRTGQTEGSVDLMRLAGLHPAAVISEVCREDGEKWPACPISRFLPGEHGLKDLLRRADHPSPTAAGTPRAPPAACGRPRRRHGSRALQGHRLPERRRPATPPGLLRG